MKILVLAIMLAALAPDMEELFNECMEQQRDTFYIRPKQDALYALWECAYVQGAQDAEWSKLKRHP